MSYIGKSKLAEFLPAMEAFAQGREIQFRRSPPSTALIDDSVKYHWSDTDMPQWNTDFEYRPKPAKKLRPYTSEELHQLVGQILVQHDGLLKRTCLVLSCDDETCGLKLGGVFDVQYAEDLLHHNGLWTHQDGTPCGVLDEQE